MAFSKTTKQKAAKPARTNGQQAGTPAQPVQAAPNVPRPSADDDDILDIPLTEDVPEPDVSPPEAEAVAFDPLAGPDLAPPPMQSVAPLYTPRWTLQRVLLILACCAVVGLSVALAMVLRRSTPSGLTVTVLDATGTNLDGLPVAVDGRPRCPGSPCVVQGLAEGAHVVQVGAPDSTLLMEQRTTVERRSNTQLVVWMAVNPQAVPARVATSAAPAGSAVPASAQSAEALVDAAEPDGSAQAAGDAPKPGASAAPAADGSKAKAAARAKGKADGASSTKGKDTAAGKSKSASGDAKASTASKPSKPSKPSKASKASKAPKKTQKSSKSATSSKAKKGAKRGSSSSASKKKK